MAGGKPSSKAESAGRKSAAAPKAPPKSHAVGKKRRGKTATAARRRQSGFGASATHLRQAVGRNITGRKRAEEALRHRAHDRGERAKEYSLPGLNKTA